MACLPRRIDRHADAGSGRLAGASEPGHDGGYRGHGHVDPDDRDPRIRQPGDYPARGASADRLPARRAHRSRLPRFYRQRFSAVDCADTSRDLVVLADPDRDHGHQLYRDPGDVRLSDEHGARPGPTRLDRPGLQPTSRRHGRIVGVVCRHLDPIADPIVSGIAGTPRQQLTSRAGNGLIGSRFAKIRIATPTGASFTTAGDYGYEMEALSPMDAEIFEIRPGSEDEFVSAARSADALYAKGRRITKRMIDGLERCKIIALGSVGVDSVDVEAATQKGIPVTNCPDTFIDEVADHAVTLIL